MRKYSFIFSVVAVAFVAAYSLAAASSTTWPVPGYLAEQVQRTCAECRSEGWIVPADIDRATLHRLVNAPCDRVRISAIYTLGEIHDRDAVGSLVSMLKWDNGHVRRSAAHALGKIGDAASVVPLVQVMNDNQEKILIRCTAARALGRISDFRAVQALRRASQGHEPILARAAGQALHGASGHLFIGSK